MPLHSGLDALSAGEGDGQDLGSWSRNIAEVPIHGKTGHDHSAGAAFGWSIASLKRQIGC